jgi:hypothetical protein
MRVLNCSPCNATLACQSWCCDNSLPHLLTDADLLTALRQMLACLVPGGGFLMSMRDYEREERGVNLVKPYGARTENGKRYVLFQVWDFAGEHRRCKRTRCARATTPCRPTKCAR